MPFNDTSLKSYFVITGAYWAFTLTDGAIRMLVVLFFHQLGYSPLAIASLFLFYELFGMITNLFGGWLATWIGLNKTLLIGMLLQIAALLMLTVPIDYLTVIYVMAAQALSGIAKDLNKMSAKAGIKQLTENRPNPSSTLFKWIAMLTGSKNTLKGVGYFLGGLLLSMCGFRYALIILASGLFIALLLTQYLLPKAQKKTLSKPQFAQLFSNTPAINWLSSARFFLFGARDIWFVVALPIYLTQQLGWQYQNIGSFLALWIIGYGIIQACSPILIKRFISHSPNGKTAQKLASSLVFIPLLIALGLILPLNPERVIIGGLTLFAVVFALNSAVHSFLIVDWSQHNDVAMNVGFYYMANAGGRLLGTILSGLIYQYYGLVGCLIISSTFIAITALISLRLPIQTTA
ncbi:MAG: putative MFS family arabinose efflux permease [Methylophagaceae bacterium]|jgi:predicted MFS family arabinose efflux permease